MNPLPEVPLVSVVTPSWNTGLFIEETIRSVHAQDHPRVEHIVLDGGSTDATPEILARYPHLRVVAPAPPTLYGKVNLGMRMARGDIVAALCADDYYLPGAVTKAVNALRAHPEAALVYCNDLRVDARGVELLRTRSKQTNFRELVDEMDHIPIQTVFMRREVFDRVGMFDTRYPLVGDWDFWIRVSREFPILYVDDWWGAFRHRDGQLSEVYKVGAWKEGRRMTRTHGGRFFSPMFRNYWAGKATRAAGMLRAGRFDVFNAKLRDLVHGFVRQ